MLKMVPRAAGPASGQPGPSGLRFWPSPPRGAAGPRGGGQRGTHPHLSWAPAPCAARGAPPPPFLPRTLFPLMRSAHPQVCLQGTVAPRPLHGSERSRDLPGVPQWVERRGLERPSLPPSRAPGRHRVKVTARSEVDIQSGPRPRGWQSQAHLSFFFLNKKKFF